MGFQAGKREKGKGKREKGKGKILQKNRIAVKYIFY